jgi:hypothetical protein
MVDNLCLYFQGGYQSSDITTSEYNRKWTNYQLFNNKLDQRDFERDCNLLGIEVGQFQDEIKPYNKMPNKIQVLLGEELRRPFTFQPVLVNNQGIRSKQMARTELFKEAVLKGIEELIQLLRQAHSSEDPQQQEEAEKKLQERMNALIPEDELRMLENSTYLDQMEIKAAKILRMLKYEEGIRDKMNDAFKHALISGEECVWVGIRQGKPVVLVINSLGLFYDKSPETKYIQDGRFAGHRTMQTTGDVIDQWLDELSEEDLKKLEGPMQGINGVRDDLIAKDMRYHNVDVIHEYMARLGDYNETEGSYGNLNRGDHVLVTHVEWKSYRKVYFLTHENEFGDLQKDIVGEEFEIPEGFQKIKKTIGPLKEKDIWTDGQMVIEESWIPEVWEGTRIGDDIYVGLRPKPYQIRNADNPYDVKLGYHGLVYNNMNSDSISLVDRMKPFQYLYFFVMHKMKQMIAKDKGQVFHFDASMVPENMSIEKVLYYLEHLDLDIYNSLQNAQSPGAAQRGKITGATNRSNMQHIMSYIQVLDALDYQISDVAGIPKPREGHTPTQQAVTNAQQDLQQSSAVTEAVYFQPHYNLWKHVLTSLLECAQVAWKDKSVVKQFALDDMSLELLELQPNELDMASFGVYISNSYEDANIFDTLKAMAQPLIQNDKARMSDLIKIVKANSIQELERYIKDSERKAEEMMMQQQQMQQETVEMQIKAQEAEREDRQLHEKELKQMELETAILLKQMDVAQKTNTRPFEEKELTEEMKMRELELEVEKAKVAAQRNRPSSS